MSGHTPRPWKVGGTDLQPMVRSPNGPLSVCIAACDEYREGEQEANARLIAAAPDMLESLRECHDLLVSAHMGTLIIGRARKAIAKAEGRT